MAARKRKSEGEDKGEGNGEGNGASPGKTLEFDDFVEEVRKRAGDFHADVHLSASVGERRTVGSRLGKLPLQPLDTLDERIDADWPGPRTIILRTKWAATGGWAITGYYDVPPPKASALASPATANDVAFSALMRRMEKSEEENKELRALLLENVKASAAKKEVETTGEQIGGLERIALVFKSMLPPPQPAAPAPPPPKTIREQLAELRDAKDMLKEITGGGGGGPASAAAVIVTELKDGLNDCLRGTAGLLAVKAGFTKPEKD